MTTPEKFNELYPGKRREQFNRAIRAECPGGDELMEARAIFCSISRRHKGEERKIADIAQQRLSAIRDDMVDWIRRKYNL